CGRHGNRCDAVIALFAGLGLLCRLLGRFFCLCRLLNGFLCLLFRRCLFCRGINGLAVIRGGLFFRGRVALLGGGLCRCLAARLGRGRGDRLAIGADLDDTAADRVETEGVLGGRGFLSRCGFGGRCLGG